MNDKGPGLYIRQGVHGDVPEQNTVQRKVVVRAHLSLSMLEVARGSEEDLDVGRARARRCVLNLSRWKLFRREELRVCRAYEANRLRNLRPYQSPGNAAVQRWTHVGRQRASASQIVLEDLSHELQAIEERVTLEMTDAAL